MARASKQTCLIVLLAASMSAPLYAAGKELLELTTASQKLEVRLEFLRGNEAWFFRRNGVVERFRIDEIKRLSKPGVAFRSLDVTTVRNSLRREFGGQISIGGSPRFLVCARENLVQPSVDLLENSYGTFSRFFQTRGLRLTPCEFPLIVVILPDRLDFTAQARKDGVQISRTLRGYFSPRTNRVILYEELSRSQLINFQKVSSGSHLFSSETLTPSASVVSLRDTLIHESIHQLGFNRGLHSRIAVNPRWLVEGVALVLESSELRSGRPGRDKGINRRRLEWWRDYRRSAAEPLQIEDLLTENRKFGRRELDAYSEAWAWTYFLLSTRSRSLSDYLKRVSNRPPGMHYEAAERIGDFRATVEEDLSRLQHRFEQFMEAL